MKLNTPLPYLVFAAAATLGAGAASAGDANAAIPTHEAPLPRESLLQLAVTLQTSEGKLINLSQFRGYPLLVTMFYAQCSSVCPLLTARLEAFVNGLDAEERRNLRVLMVSFDAERDSPAVLRAFKLQHSLQDANWVIARASPRDVRAFSAALGIRYRELPDHSFNHSAQITLLDRDGVIRARTADLANVPAAFAEATHRTLHESP